MTQQSDVDLAYGTTHIELVDVLEFQTMATDFTAGCAVGPHDITLMMGDALDSGWEFFTHDAVGDLSVVLLRRGLIENLPVFDQAEPKTPDIEVEGDEEPDFGLKTPIVNSAEYVLIALIEGGVPHVIQATVIQDDDENFGDVDIRDRFVKLFDEVPTP